MHFVGNTSISWNDSLPTAVSTTGAASAAISVRPPCGQVATGSTQEMVSGSKKPLEGLWAWPYLEASLKVEENWGAGMRRKQAQDGSVIP